MAVLSSPGFLGQIQIAPDSALTPGTFAAFSETAKWTMSPKVSTPDATPYQAYGMGRIATVRDFDFGADGFYDFGDGGITNLLNSVFPSLIGSSASPPQTRIWANLLDSQTTETQLAGFVSELTLSSDSPSDLTKFGFKGGFDGTPTQPYTTSAAGVVVAPTTALNPAVQYNSFVQIGSSVTNTFTAGEPMSQIGATTSYQITAPAKRFLDYTTALVLGGGAAGNYTVDAQFGIFTFANALTAAPTVTSGKYWTLAKLIGNTKFTSTMSFTLDSKVTGINSGGYMMRAPTQRDIKASLGLIGLFNQIPNSSAGAIGANTVRNLWENRAVFPVEFDPDGQQQRVLRGWFLIDQEPESPTSAEIVQQTLSLVGADQTLRGSPTNSSGSKMMLVGFSMGAP